MTLTLSSHPPDKHKTSYTSHEEASLKWKTMATKRKMREIHKQTPMPGTKHHLKTKTRSRPSNKTKQPPRPYKRLHSRPKLLDQQG